MLLPTSTLQVRYFEGDLSDFAEHPIRISCPIYIVIISGTGTLETGTDRYRLQPQMELSFMSGCIIYCSDCSNDLYVKVFTYSSQLLTQISLPIEQVYFDYNEAHPCYIHTPDKRSQRTWREMLVWMDMAKMLFAEEASIRFRLMQEKSFMQGFWMWNFSTIQERLGTDKGFSNTQIIAHRFICMVKEEATLHHQVEYYADRLSITQRYLNRIVSQHTNGRTPKQLIDAQLIAEIKERLIDTDLSVTQLAYKLNFPDQSYLSRFFSRHTGISPAQYRISHTCSNKYAMGT